LYKEVLQIDLPWLDNITKAKAPQRLPVVLTQSEVKRVLDQLEGARWLMASLLQGWSSYPIKPLTAQSRPMLPGIRFASSRLHPP
jgi:hypothetical protein